MAAGDFTVPDATTTGTELSSLFGVAQGVGDAPVVFHAAVPASHRVTAVGTVFENPGTPALTKTLTETLQQFYTLGGAALQDWQRRLYLGGYFPASYYGPNPKTPQFGSADDDSYAAFKSAAVQAARSGRPLDDVINTAMASTAAGGGPGAKKAIPPAVLQPPSPIDIRAQVVASAKDKYGHGAPEAVVNHIIDEYQRLTVAQQQALNTAQVSGGTVPQVPNLSSFVDERLQQAAPTDVAMNGALGAANLVMQAFQGGSGG